MQSTLDKEHVITFTLHSRALLMEMLGTFILCYFSLMVPNNIGAGSNINDSVYSVGIIAISLAYGYAHLIGRHISGGHYNPAVSLAMAFTGKMPYMAAFIYIFFQFLGGALGAYLTGYIYNIDLKTLLTRGQSFYYVQQQLYDLQFIGSLTVETIGTLLLILVFLRTLEIKQEDTTLAAAAIGLTQLFTAIGGWLLTGWGNNPARMFGITFFNNTVTNPQFWIYYLGPFLAAIFAWFFERYLLADSHGEFGTDMRKVTGWFKGSKPNHHAEVRDQEEVPAPPLAIPIDRTGADQAVPPIKPTLGEVSDEPAQ